MTRRILIIAYFALSFIAGLLFSPRVAIGSPVSVSATWSAVTEDIDDQPENVAGYFLYWSVSPRGSDTRESNPDVYPERVDTGGTTSYTLSDIEGGKRYYFALTAYDIWGNESEFSEEIAFDVPATDAKYNVSGGCGMTSSEMEQNLLFILLVPAILIFLLLFIRNIRKTSNLELFA